jgi:hypothetical protein
MKDELGVVVGFFNDPDVILHAADSARKKGWKDLDAIVPYPIHGMEHALGIRMSWVPWVTLIMGLLGVIGGFGLQAWVSAVAWPLNIGGKPLISWPAFIPVTFECGILIGGISTFIAMWAACKLPNKKPRIFDERLTDDRFALVVPIYEGIRTDDVSTFLKGAGADDVRIVEK